MSGPISLVTAVRDRPAALRASLPVWSEDPAIAEIVVVDWGSALPLAMTGILEFPKVVLVEAGARAPWAPGLALNLGIAASSGALVLRLEPGARLRDGHDAASRLATRKGYLSGHGERASALLARRGDVDTAAGFNEFLLGAGFEDQDLYNRLEDRGTPHLFFRDDDLVPIPFAGIDEGPRHVPGDIRIALPDGLARNPVFQAERNKLLAGLAPWSAELASLRARRATRADARHRAVELAPPGPLELRLQDVASYFAARLVFNVPEETAYPMIAAMIDDRAPHDAARALRQHQIELAQALRMAGGR